MVAVGPSHRKARASDQGIHWRDGAARNGMLCAMPPLHVTAYQTFLEPASSLVAR